MSVSDRRDARVLCPGIALCLAGWFSLEYVALARLSWMYGYGGTLETTPIHHLSLLARVPFPPDGETRSEEA
jgi:hypothetical protein